MFWIEPERLDLKVDESKDITIWAFPHLVGIFEDALMCHVDRNPTPVTFALRCEGAKPKIECSLDKITFEKLLLGQSDNKTLTLRNLSSLSVSWALVDPDPPLPDTTIPFPSAELTIQPRSGVLRPQSQGDVQVAFKAVEQKEINVALNLQVKDVDGVLGVVDTKLIAVSAEAFRIAAKVTLPETGIDFGSVRVGEEAFVDFPIHNEGKYPIEFKIVTAPKPKALLVESFTIDPLEKVCCFTFCRSLLFYFTRRSNDSMQ